MKKPYSPRCGDSAALRQSQHAVRARTQRRWDQPVAERNSGQCCSGFRLRRNLKSAQLHESRQH